MQNVFFDRDEGGFVLGFWLLVLELSGEGWELITNCGLRIRNLFSGKVPDTFV